MGEPMYHTVGEFAKTYGFDQQEVRKMIGLGVLRPRRMRGNSILTETDMVRFVQWNTAQRKKRPDSGQ